MGVDGCDRDPDAISQAYEVSDAGIAAVNGDAYAGYGIGTRIFSVIFLPALAVSQGIETMTGQNIGAREQDRAAATNHFGARAMLGILTVVGLLILVAAQPIASVFTNDPAVVAESATFLRVATLTFGFIGVMRAYTGGFRGAGQTLIAAAISILTLGAIRLPVAWVAANALGSLRLWIAFPVSNVLGGIIAYLWFSQGTWRGGSLTGSGSRIGDRGLEISTTDD